MDVGITIPPRTVGPRLAKLSLRNDRGTDRRGRRYLRGGHLDQAQSAEDSGLGEEQEPFRYSRTDRSDVAASTGRR